MRESRYNTWVRRPGERIVHNGVSGAFVRVPDDAWPGVEAFLAGRSAPAPDATIMFHLVRAHAVINDDADELGLLERRYQRAKRNDGRFALTVVTSLGCNFGCPYCYETKRPVLLSEENQASLRALADEVVPGLACFAVTWFGGEPLLGRAALAALSRHFQRVTSAHGVTYEAGIVTNGHLLDRETAVELRALGVTDAQITLDGPAEVHDARRFLLGGRGSYATVAANVASASEVLDVTVRVNLDHTNADAAEMLLDDLVARGLAGRIGVYAAAVVVRPDRRGASCCLGSSDFAALESRFLAAAADRGFAVSPPAPVGTPCTAVRENELVVGAEGELYKCWESVGNPDEVIGDLRHWRDPDDRVLKWLRRDPFTDPECRACSALPVCMGGCTAYALEPALADRRCSSFRRNAVQRIEAAIS